MKTLTTVEKIKKAGYKLTSLIGYRNGSQCITGVSIEKDNGQFVNGRPMQFTSATKALQYIKGY